MTKNWLQKSLDFFNDPCHVASFQKYFQLEWAPPSKSPISSDGSELNRRKNGQETPVSSDYDSRETSESEGDQTDERHYVIGNNYWFWLFRLGTALGEEVFYASMFPFWFWNIDGAVGRRVIIIWALSMYVGQCLKDIICWSRPASPPVIRMQKKCALEYGMPSTHAMVSITVPFSVVLLTMNRYEYPVIAGFAIVIAWCILVSTSRLYLGMHSIADLIGGWILAIVLLPAFLPLVDPLDSFILAHPASPGLIVTTTITLMLLYPGQNVRDTTAKEDTAVILGSASGIQLGAWLSYQLGSIRGPPVKPPYPVIYPSYEMLGLCLLRTTIGLVLIVATRAITKSLSYAAMRALAKLSKDKKEKEDLANAELFVKIGCKLITYGAIGINITWFSPAVFRLLGIERPTFHTEI